MFSKFSKCFHNLKGFVVSQIKENFLRVSVSHSFRNSESDAYVTYKGKQQDREESM